MTTIRQRPRWSEHPFREASDHSMCLSTRKNTQHHTNMLCDLSLKRLLPAGETSTWDDDGFTSTRAAGSRRFASGLTRPFFNCQHVHLVPLLCKHRTSTGPRSRTPPHLDDIRKGGVVLGLVRAEHLVRQACGVELRKVNRRPALRFEGVGGKGVVEALVTHAAVVVERLVGEGAARVRRACQLRATQKTKNATSAAYTDTHETTSCKRRTCCKGANTANSQHAISNTTSDGFRGSKVPASLIHIYLSISVAHADSSAAACPSR